MPFIDYTREPLLVINVRIVHNNSKLLRWHTYFHKVGSIGKLKYRGSVIRESSMPVRHPRYSKEEFARRGHEIYETQVRPQVEEDDRGKIVAIDIETGDFEVDKSEIAACERLEARHPNAQIWIVRIGSRHVRRFGERTRKLA
jgi:hypothetical protein